MWKKIDVNEANKPSTLLFTAWKKSSWNSLRTAKRTMEVLRRSSEKHCNLTGRRLIKVLSNIKNLPNLNKALRVIASSFYQQSLGCIRNPANHQATRVWSPSKNSVINQRFQSTNVLVISSHSRAFHPNCRWQPVKLKFSKKIFVLKMSGTWHL